MVRMYAMYQPLRVFFLIGTILMVLGLVPVLRFLYFYAVAGSAGHVQSLLLGAIFLIMGFIAYLAGLVADLIGFNRQLLEMTLERVRRMELAAIARHGDPAAGADLAAAALGQPADQVAMAAGEGKAAVAEPT